VKFLVINKEKEGGRMIWGHSFKEVHEAQECLTELKEKMVNLETSRPNKRWDKARISRKILKLKFENITLEINHKKIFRHFLEDVGMRGRSR
jgi:hypothetical protein